MRTFSVVLFVSLAIVFYFWTGSRQLQEAERGVDTESQQTGTSTPARQDQLSTSEAGVNTRTSQIELTNAAVTATGVGDEPVQDIREVEAGPVAVGAVVRVDLATTLADMEARVWPYDGDVMESIVRNELAQVPGLKGGPDLTIDCTTTVCEIRYTSIGPDRSVMDSRFVDTFEDYPYGAHFEFSGQRLGFDPRGAPFDLNLRDEFEIAITLRSNPRPKSRDRLRREADSIWRRARSFLSTDSDQAPPVVWGNRGGADLFIENVCSLDCPRDTRQIIYLEVPDGRSCDMYDGTETTSWSNGERNEFRRKATETPTGSQPYTA